MDMITGGDTFNRCSPSVKIKIKATYSKVSLQEALRLYPKCTWHQCRLAASRKYKAAMGRSITYEAKYITDLWRAYGKNDSFPYPLGPEATMSDFKRKDQPPFFKGNPDLKEHFTRFCRVNLADLSTRRVGDYLTHVLFPAAATPHNPPPLMVIKNMRIILILYRVI
jgi:hypothetical protein